MVSSCPYCRAPFETGDDLALCTGCGTTHHADCLTENGGCTVFGCSQAPLEEAKISVTNQEAIHQPLIQPTPFPQPPVGQPSAPYSFLNLQPLPPVAPSYPGIAPPPRPDGSIPYLTPPPTSVLPYQPYPPYTSPTEYPTFAGYAPAAAVTPAAYANYYEPRKSRVVFVLMAVFLGPFGGHNFYAGYTTKAIIQLCITVLTCFFGSFISWIWAIVEACIVDHDSDNIAFV